MEHAPVNIPDLLRKARQTLAINSHMLETLTAVDTRLAMLARTHGGDVRNAAVALRGLIAKAMDKDPDNLKGGRPMRRASPIRDEDILEVAMERFWAAPGGNGEGVKAVIEFCRNVFLDQADDAS